MDFREILNVVEVVVAVGVTIWAYFRFRGRNFGLTDLLIFLPLAIGADWLIVWLFHVVRGSPDYGGLVALLLLLGLLPVAAGLTVVAVMATIVCLSRYPAVRAGALGLLVLLWVAYFIHGHRDEANEPGGVLNNDRLAGENWALESGARSKADCDRQSSAQAFREGCYSRLGR